MIWSPWRTEMVRSFDLGDEPSLYRVFAATPEAARLTSLVHLLLPSETSTDTDTVTQPGGDAS